MEAVGTPQYFGDTCERLSNVLKDVFPLLHQSHPLTPVLLTLFALIVPLLLFSLFRQIRRMQNENATPFPFMELPPELRDMVYEYLVEDPYYPPPPTNVKQNGSSLNWMLPARWSPASSEAQAMEKKRSNWVFLASKQVYKEYMDIICKRGTFHLTVSPNNYKADVEPNKIWQVAPDTLKQLRKCDIKLITTSSMLGVPDPRNMRPEEWALARQIREELKEVKKVQELNLHVKAIGDPLWNPLWVWYHASQSFKTMGSSHALSSPTGPKLNRITFSLDTWSPGENYLERDPKHGNQWAWFCMKGHSVGADNGAEMTVREFCTRLYMECRICRPELESEDEED